MKSRLKISLLGVMFACVMLCAVLPASAAQNTLPSIIIKQQNAVITRTQGQNTFDLSELYSIDSGTFNESDITKTVGVNKDGTNLPDGEITNNTIAFSDGTYYLDIFISYNDNGIKFKSERINFELKTESPSFRNAEAMEGYREFNVQKNQAMIDLRVFYRIVNNSFSDSEYKVSYEVTYPGRVIEIFGHNIPAISGIYNITITIEPIIQGAFVPIVSPAIIVKVQKLRPAVVFEYEGESENIPIEDNKHTIDIFNLNAPVELKTIFTIYGNAYVSNEYVSSLIVRRKITDTKSENIQVFDSRIAAVPGVYYITVKVNPRIQGAFSPVTSETLTLTLIKAVPEISVRDTVYSGVSVKGKYNLSNYISLSSGAYQRNEIEVTYEVKKGKKSISVSDGQLNDKPGKYNVTVKLRSVTGEFDEFSESFVLVVAGFPDWGIALTVTGGVVLLLAGVGVTLWFTVFKRKNKTAGD